MKLRNLLKTTSSVFISKSTNNWNLYKHIRADVINRSTGVDKGGPGPPNGRAKKI